MPRNSSLWHAKPPTDGPRMQWSALIACNIFTEIPDKSGRCLPEYGMPLEICRYTGCIPRARRWSDSLHIQIEPQLRFTPHVTRASQSRFFVRNYSLKNRFNRTKESNRIGTSNRIVISNRIGSIIRIESNRNVNLIDME